MRQRHNISCNRHKRTAVAFSPSFFSSCSFSSCLHNIGRERESLFLTSHSNKKRILCSIRNRFDFFQPDIEQINALYLHPRSHYTQQPGVKSNLSSPQL